MTDTTFVAEVTRIRAAWLNPVNKWTYQGVNPSFVTSTGTGTAYVVTLPDSTLTALTAGQTIAFKAHLASTGPATLEVVGASTTTALPLRMNSLELNAGNIPINTVIVAVYLNSVWHVIGSSAMGVFNSLSVITNAGNTLLITEEGDVTFNIPAGNTFIIEGDGEITFATNVTFEGDVDMSSATSVTYLDGSIELNDLSTTVTNLIQSFNSAGSSGVNSGNGRLSLASGERVMNQDYTAKTISYYVGTFISLNTGDDTFAGQLMVENSNTTTDATRNPAAAGTNQTIDLFQHAGASQSVTSITRASQTATVTKNSHGYVDGEEVIISGAAEDEYNGPYIVAGATANTFTYTIVGTPTSPATGTIVMKGLFLSRGPAWRNGGTAITGATNATPVVLTCNSHGFSNGDLVTVENTGGNTGANGTYVAASVSANNITLTGSVGNGVYITGTGSVAGRGVGAGTTELQLIGSTYVNKNAITNGPAAKMGTYVGTIRTNGSSQLDWKLGSIAVGGGEAWLGVWNVSNGITFEISVTESTASWTMGAGSRTFGRMNGSSTNRVSFVRGLNIAGVSASQSICIQPGAGTGAGCTIAADSITEAMQGQQGALASHTQGIPATVFNTTLVANARGNNFFGFHFLQGMEENSASVPASTAATPVFAGNLNGAHTGLYGVVLNARLTQ